MKRLWQAVKDLYSCEDAGKRHVAYASLLILPSVCGAFAGMVDKDTPKEVLGICLIGVLVFGILSIIPLLFTSGFWIQLCRDRFDGIVGIPKLNPRMMLDGLKLIPLGITWGFYFLCLAGVMVVVPIILFAALLTTSHSNPLGAILLVLAIILLYLLFLAISMLISPFIACLMLKFAKTGKYSPDLFNPFGFVPYMKKAFKPIIMIALKLLVFTMIFGTVIMILYVLFFMISFIIGYTGGLADPSVPAEAIMYKPFPMTVIMVGSVLLAIIQSYGSSMLGYAGADNYIEVYKKEFDNE